MRGIAAGITEGFSRRRRLISRTWQLMLHKQRYTYLLGNILVLASFAAMEPVSHTTRECSDDSVRPLGFLYIQWNLLQWVYMSFIVILYNPGIVVTQYKKWYRAHLWQVPLRRSSGFPWIPMASGIDRNNFNYRKLQKN